MVEITEKLMPCLWLICMLLAICGSVYGLFAAYLTRQLGRKRRPPATVFPGISVLKPLYGAEPELVENLASFCRQIYHGPVQIVCGIQNPADPAKAAVVALQQTYPRHDIDLVANSAEHGQNRKISNLINMMSVVRHNLLVLSDSDMRVSPEYLGDIAAALEKPGAGAVTCLYRGLARDNLWSKLAAMNIDQRFMPNVLVGLRLGMASPCFGSTIAMRAETLALIGGFEAFADQLADDYRIGAAVRSLGLSVEIPPTTLAHLCAETSLAALWTHELRWARTIRLVDPMGYAGSAITHPVPFAVFAAALGGLDILGVGSVVLALVCRALIPIQLQPVEGSHQPSLWLLPVREFMSFAVFLASFLPLPVTWRGHRYDVRSDGTLTPT